MTAASRPGWPSGPKKQPGRWALANASSGKSPPIETSGIPHVRFGKAVLYPVDMLREWLVSRAGGMS